MNQLPRTRLTNRLITFVAVMCLSSSLTAGTGNIQVLPMGTSPPRHGLQLEIDSRWIEGNGYRPVRITVNTVSLAGSTGRRELTISLAPNPTSLRGDSASTTIVLDAGVASVTKTLLVRQNSPWSNLRTRVVENGKLLEELSANFGIRRNRVTSTTEAFPNFLFIDADAPLRANRIKAIAKLATRVPIKIPMKLPVPKLPKLTSLSSVIVTQAYRAQSITTAIQDAASLQYAEGVSRVELLSPAEIPKNWLALTSVDIICISLTDIEVMQNTTPAAWSAVDRWVRAGGVLWITGVGSNHKQLASLLKLADSEAFPYGWSMPPPRKRNFVAGSVSELAGIKTNVYRSRRDSRLITRSPVRRGKKTGPKKKKRTVRRPARRRQPSIFHRRLGLGTVLAFGSERPFRGKVEAIVALNTLGGRSWMWYQRHGMSMHRHNSGFWNFLISGVGEAPVASFLILISLFAVVIGPLNYASLRRGGRQFLMLITVPSGAALVTAFLVVYATFGDGFGVKVRTRSVIHIDQRTGQSTTWSRQNYYASMAPSRGLVFPSDSAVYHIQYSPKRNNKPPFRRTDWSSGDQRLSGGFMTSRDWCQLLVIRNRETTAGLAITDNGTKPPTVLNQLGTKVVTLVLVDESGNIYTSENIGINEPAQLQATTLKDVNKMLLDISTSNMMGVNRSALRRAESMARRQHYSQIIDRDAPAVRTGNSLLERSIVESLESFNPQPKTYLALVEDSTEVPLGTKAKRYESFEMVIGRW